MTGLVTYHSFRQSHALRSDSRPRSCSKIRYLPSRLCYVYFPTIATVRALKSRQYQVPVPHLVKIVSIIDQFTLNISISSPKQIKTMQIPIKIHVFIPYFRRIYTELSAKDGVEVPSMDEQETSKTLSKLPGVSAPTTKMRIRQLLESFCPFWKTSPWPLRWQLIQQQ
ncbi:hypothetical protein BDD12DRAFT_200803 [Trichophaea hybrida]|nr:hypothetical protein BDD12DRAFT_200803 [Trichophaea hybrida]